MRIGVTVNIDQWARYAPAVTHTETTTQSKGEDTSMTLAKQTRSPFASRHFLGIVSGANAGDYVASNKLT